MDVIELAATEQASITTEPTQELTPELPGTDERGWHKDSVWREYAPDTCGDYAVGNAYNARYWRDRGDGTFGVVTETYFVEPSGTYNQPEVVRAWDCIGRYEFTICKDHADPGGTEVATVEITYDRELHAQFLWSYEDARAMAERMARSDQRFTLSAW